MLISYKTIGQRIKERRKHLGLSQIDLSVDANISTSYLCNVELGNKCVSLEILIRIANALSTTTDILLSDCLTCHIKVSSNEINTILEDCSLFESRVIIDTIKELKKSLRTNSFTRNTYNI